MGSELHNKLTIKHLDNNPYCLAHSGLEPRKDVAGQSYAQKKTPYD